jgi:hypothetical protein
LFNKKNCSENLYQNINSNDLHLKPIQYPRSSSYHPLTTIMSNNTIEQKLRNLQINLAQGRTQEELAQAGIYFPPPTSSPSSSSQQQQQQQNAFSNYIDSVHRALDSSKQQQQQTKGDSTNMYYDSPYHNDYIPHDYKRASTFQIPFNQPNEQRNYLNNNIGLNLTNILRPPVPPRQSLFTFLILF